MSHREDHDRDDREPEDDIPRPRQTSGLAVASLILGLSSLCLCLATGLPALICGGISLVQIGRSKGQLSGSGLAIAGLLLGLLGSCVGSGGLGYVLYVGYQSVDERRITVNNLKQIGLGMHTHNDVTGALPTAVPVPNDPHSRLSWRVHLLPYLEHDNLYRQFHLDEPWDSEHNRPLLDQMPAIYAAGHKRPGQTTTPFRVFVGELAPFNRFGRTRIPADFPDGTSNTFLVVEAADEVPWTKPDELEYSQNARVPRLGPDSRAYFYVLLADGSVRPAQKNLPDQTLRGLITSKGAEVFGPW